ncbi:2-oxoacid:acceptor oxidoreductase subunit alpha [bacterium]|nr:2-oxoacid:acceptor oxidoreductase subunit alpha [bacterium]
MPETTAISRNPARPVEEVPSVVIRLAGDSGDGMQLTGTQFTATSFAVGNDLSTLPDYPAEIRAPAGTLAGVSGFQLQFSSEPVHTPGDTPDILVAMNAAALKANIDDLVMGGIIIANTSGFGSDNLRKAGYESNPLEDGSLSSHRVHSLDITRLTQETLAESPLSNKEKGRCKNFFALGLLYWLYNRPLDNTRAWITKKFAASPDIVAANLKVLKAGYNFGEMTEIFSTSYRVRRASLDPGTYRHVTGNSATAMGLVTAARLAGTPLFFGSYPITPASEILHELSHYTHYDVSTFQAEDEIAAVCSAIGASYGGTLAATASSGPGIDLKAEALGLAVVAELPLIVINVQRAGPSTGMPTKPEQSDLLLAMFGRHGECPMPILAPATPADCFDVMIEAARIAVTHMTPVMVLSDGFVANSSEPWLLPDLDALPRFAVRKPDGANGVAHFDRDLATLGRPWVVPGTPGMTYRIGGLEKDLHTGNVSYDPENHEAMMRMRADKMDAVANGVPDLEVTGPDSGDLLVIGWGSTAGGIRTMRERLARQGVSVATAHLRHLNPLPKNLGEVVRRYRTVLIPELNSGQLLMLLRAKYEGNFAGFPKVQGRPFRVVELVERALAIVKETN